MKMKIRDLIQKEYDKDMECYYNCLEEQKQALNYTSYNLAQTFLKSAKRINQILENAPVFDYLPMDKIRNFDTFTCTILEIIPTNEYHTKGYNKAVGSKNFFSGEFNAYGENSANKTNYVLIKYQYNLNREIDPLFFNLSDFLK